MLLLSELDLPEVRHQRSWQRKGFMYYWRKDLRCRVTNRNRLLKEISCEGNLHDADVIIRVALGGDSCVRHELLKVKAYEEGKDNSQKNRPL